MIKHIVIWRLKNRDNEQSREKTARAIEDFKSFIGARGSERYLVDYDAHG